MAGSWDNWKKAQGVQVMGEAKQAFCLAPATDTVTPVAFTNDDFMGELNDIGSPGASRDTTEINAYRYDSKAKIAGASTPNDLALKLNMNKADLDLLRGYYDNQTQVAFGMFIEQSGSPTTYPLVYGAIGTIASWEFNAAVGDVAQITANFAVINDAVAHTYKPS